MEKTRCSGNRLPPKFAKTVHRWILGERNSVSLMAMRSIATPVKPISEKFDTSDGYSDLGSSCGNFAGKLAAV
jgi:hypothetical protein